MVILGMYKLSLFFLKIYSFENIYVILCYIFDDVLELNISMNIHCAMNV